MRAARLVGNGAHTRVATAICSLGAKLTNSRGKVMSRGRREDCIRHSTSSAGPLNSLQVSASWKRSPRPRFEMKTCSKIWNNISGISKQWCSLPVFFEIGCDLEDEDRLGCGSEPNIERGIWDMLLASSCASSCASSSSYRPRLYISSATAIEMAHHFWHFSKSTSWMPLQALADMRGR